MQNFCVLLKYLLLSIFIKSNLSASCEFEEYKEHLSAQAASKASLNINFIWFFKELYHRQNYLFPDISSLSSDQRDKYDMVDAIKRWGKANYEHDTILTFNYDGEYVTKNALANTRCYLENQLEFNIFQRLKFFDIRNSKLIVHYPHLYKADAPVHFRKDVACFMLALESMQNNGQQTFLYTDIGVTAQPRGELFDTKTNDYLNRYGVTFLRHRVQEHSLGGSNGYENSFMMLRHNAVVLKSINNILLKPLNAIMEQYCASYNVRLFQFEYIQQSVYAMIPLFFMDILHNLNVIKLSYCTDKSDTMDWDSCIHKKSLIYFCDTHTDTITQYLTIMDVKSGQPLFWGGLIYLTRLYYYDDTDRDILQAQLDGYQEQLRINTAYYNQLVHSLKILDDLSFNSLKSLDCENRTSHFINNNYFSIDSDKRHLKIEINNLETFIYDYQGRIVPNFEEIQWPSQYPIPTKRMISPPSSFNA